MLGLVIERPGHGYELAQRLQARFGSFAFAPSGVYAALETLRRDRLVRAVGGTAPSSAPDGAVAPGRSGASGARLGQRAPLRVTYEATLAGVSHFEAWMLRSSPSPPVREELHMKIAFCHPSHVPRLIDEVYGEELACHARLGELERTAAAQARADTDDSHAIRALATDAEIALWHSRIQWLGRARELLHDRVERAPSAANGLAPAIAPDRAPEPARARGPALVAQSLRSS